MNVVIDKVMKRQRESDDKYVKLEFKHMKMEEQLMEMANERRKEDREFQLSMMSQGPLPFPSMTPPHYIQSHNIIQAVAVVVCIQIVVVEVIQCIVPHHHHLTFHSGWHE